MTKARTPKEGDIVVAKIAAMLISGERWHRYCNGTCVNPEMDLTRAVRDARALLEEARREESKCRRSSL